MIRRIILSLVVAAILAGLVVPGAVKAQSLQPQFMGLTGGGGDPGFGGGGNPSIPDPLPGGGSTPGSGTGGGGTPPTNCKAGVDTFLGFRTWDACLEHDSKGVPQIKSLEDVGKIGLMVVEFFIKLIGYLAVGFIVWGGIKYLKSQGEPGETAAARQIITNALMGLVLAILSVAIIQFIVGIF
ncbi:MAG TPA: hypothetical protein VFO38_01190 [Candidatus Saccharimonadales bacterium]|nr:hypothetical protein [Candidatus Saccharimonadales bacterium]